ncbi:hypothetical protein CP118TE_13020 [Clostridium perfringens E]|uniref:phage tail protein n=1 Tax=Clostridium perfringens TaxID=1502 RepID=UPI0021F975CD|nr:hypothetical protein [Clostridium perfringens]BDC01593.1 hypothetical protein CP118TE_13020 [Clostridium perfringens E]
MSEGGGMTLERLQVIIEAQTKGVREEIAKVNKQVKHMSDVVNKETGKVRNSFKNLFAGISIGYGLAKIGQYIKNSTLMAMKVEGAIQQIKRTMGESSQQFLKWANDSALAFNMSKSDALNYGAIYSNLVSGFTNSTEQTFKYTTELLKASSIIASGTGRTMADVMERIRSGLLGNTEAIEDLGVNVNVAMLQSTEAFKRFANGKSWDQLDFQTQQQIRLFAILEQTTKKFGGEVFNNTNSSLQQLVAVLKDVALNIGNAFLPILNVVLPILTKFAMGLREVTGHIATFMQTLFGQNTQKPIVPKDSMQGLSKEALKGVNAQGQYNKELDKTGKKAKKLSNLMGFDEINKLQKKEPDESSGGINPSGLNNVAEQTQKTNGFVDGLIAKFNELKDLFKEGFKTGLGDDFENSIKRIKAHIQGIKESLKNIFLSPEVINASNKWVNAVALNLGKVTGSIASIGLSIGENLIGGVDKYLSQNTEYIKSKIVSIFDTHTEIANILGNVSVAIAKVFEVFRSDAAKQCTADFIGIFANAYLGATDISLKFGRDILNCITQPIIDNADKFKLAIENTLAPLSTILSTLNTAVKDTFDQMALVYDEHLKPMFDAIAAGLSSIVSTILDAYNTYIAPMLQALADQFATVWTTSIQPTINKLLELIGKIADALTLLCQNVIVPLINWIITNVVPLLAPIIETIVSLVISLVGRLSEILGGIIDILSGIIDFIIGVFTGDWSRAWQGIQEIFGGIWEVIKGIVCGVIDFIQAYITTIIQAISGTVQLVLSALRDSIHFVLSTISNIVISIVDGIYNAICKSLDYIKSRYTEFKDFAFNIWQSIKNIFSSFSSWLDSVFTTDWTQSFGTFGNIINAFMRNVQNVWNSIKRIFGGIIDFVTGVFTGNWSRAWQGVVDIFGGIMSGLGAVLKAPLNIVIGLINTAIGGLNKISITTPDWLPGGLGGKHFGVNLPKIPYLAKGGVVNSATLAMIGEAGKEAVVPLENNTGWTDKVGALLANSLINLMQVNNGNNSNNQGGDLILELKVADDKIGDLIIKSFRRLERKTGKQILNI